MRTRSCRPLANMQFGICAIRQRTNRRRISMFRVLTCLTGEHDWRLVVLAGLVCFAASIVAINIFHRANASQARTRLIWIAIAGAAIGYGIWATHFIAMLAYEPGVPTGYGTVLTALSLARRDAADFQRVWVLPQTSRSMARADWRRDHGRRHCQHALYRHVGARSAGPCELVARPRVRFHRARHVVRLCRARHRGALSRSFGNACRRPVADARHRLASFHRHGRGGTRPRPDAGARRVVAFSRLLALGDCGRGHDRCSA